MSEMIVLVTKMRKCANDVYNYNIMSDKESLVLVISRFELDPLLIPPLKVIIPMLSSLYTVRVFTSLDN
jgi:hypothetical protein